MAIVWEGNKKEFGTSHQSPPVQQNAVYLYVFSPCPFGNHSSNRNHLYSNNNETTTYDMRCIRIHGAYISGA